MVHDVALQRLPLVLCLDRAGLVGADGATHNGVFDISYLGHIPNVVIAAPKDEFEMEELLKLGLAYPHIFAIRYPRGNVPRVYEEFPKQPFNIGEGEVLREGGDASLLAIGTMVETALKVHEILKAQGVLARVVNMRFAKPLDGKLISDCLSKSRSIFTLEEHVLTGGFGSKVLEFLEQQKLLGEASVTRFALPDQFIEQGSRDRLFDHFGLSPEKIAARVLKELHSQNSVPLI